MNDIKNTLELATCVIMLDFYQACYNNLGALDKHRFGNNYLKKSDKYRGRYLYLKGFRDYDE